MKKIKNYIIKNQSMLISLILIGLIILFSLSTHYINKEFFNDNRLEEETSNKINKPTDTLPDRKKKIIGVPVRDDKEEKETKEKQKNYTDEYKKYEELTEDEKKKIDVIPRKEEVPVNEIENIEENIEYKEETVIPSYYNLKDHYDIKVENQASFGLCWDFASMKSLETNILLHTGEYFDFSEIHPDYYMSELMYGYREIHSGGNFSTFIEYANFSGTVLESDAEYRDYDESEYNKFIDMKRQAYVTDYVDFPRVSKDNGQTTNMTEEELQKFRNLIKTHIMKNGSLYTEIRPTTEINAYCNTDCYRPTPAFDTPNHAVSIIGWDDNYSKNNFKSEDGSHPIHDGAYIILNSWGTQYHDGGYYYISYDDARVEASISGVISTSMDDTIKINDIKSYIVKNIIDEKLNQYIIKYKGEDYITNAMLKTITYLDLSNKNLTSNDLSELKIFSNLSSINLSNNNITSVDFLTTFNRLNYVNLSNNQITDVSVLSVLENLTGIDLKDNINVKGYSKLLYLTELNLSNTNLNNIEDVKQLDLFALDISNNPNLNYYQLELPANLHDLSLENTNYSNQVIFENLNELSMLNLQHNNIKSLDMLKNLRNLYELNVSYNEIKDFTILKTILANRYNEDGDIKEFNLIASHNRINDITIFNDMNITNLVLDNNEISNLSQFKNNKTTSLNLSHNKLSDISKFKNENIIEIDLSYNNITTGFTSLKDINIVNLEGCNISNLQEFKNLNGVLDLNINNNKIESLKDLSLLKNLTTLTANNNYIDISDINGFASLEDLSLNNNGIKDITPLSRLKTLTILSLTNNKSIKGSLTGSINYLNLSDCDLSKDLKIGVDSLYQVILSKNKNFIDFYNNSNLSTYSNLYIEVEDIEITKDQFMELYNEESTVFIDGIILKMSEELNSQDKTIGIEDIFKKSLMKQFIREGLKIDNGMFNKTADKIYIDNIYKNEVSFSIKISNFPSLKVYIALEST